MTTMMVLTEADLRRLVPARRRCGRLRRGCFRGARHQGCGDAADPAPRHPRPSTARSTSRPPTFRASPVSPSRSAPASSTIRNCGLPSVNGLMVYFSAETGLVEALLLDNGYLTDVRTAAAGAVAAKHLAPGDAAVAAILGAGVQAQSPTRSADAGASDPRGADLGARRSDAAEATAAELSKRAGHSASTAVADRRGCGARRRRDRHHHARDRADPEGRVARRRPARHGNGIGRRTQERDRSRDHSPGRALCRRQPRPDAPPWRIASRHRRRGWCRPTGFIPSLARSSRARRPAGRPPIDLTLCDLTGTGVQDTAIATLAVARARAANAGTVFET